MQFTNPENRDFKMLEKYICSVKNRNFPGYSIALSLVVNHNAIVEHFMFRTKPVVGDQAVLAFVLTIVYQIM